MKHILGLLFAACAGFLSLPAWSAGVIPLALTQQIDVNGQPLAGCLTYYFTAGTVATPQQVYQDFNLTQPSPNPTTCDATGRVPLVWIADGLVHVRLTTSTGTVVLDTTMQVLGPSGGGGGGGGGTVDPTAVAQTGDTKFRITNETPAGWVVANGTSIGSAASGATQRANADTQALYVYLWNNCVDSLCGVSGGRGASANADFTANKAIATPPMQDRIPAGRTCMGGACGSWGTDTAFASGGYGGSATVTLSQGHLPAVTFFGSASVSGASHNHGVNGGFVGGTGSAGVQAGGAFSAPIGAANVIVQNSGVLSMSGSAQVNSGGGNQPFAIIPPYLAGTWLIKL